MSRCTSVDSEIVEPGNVDAADAFSSGCMSSNRPGCCLICFEVRARGNLHASPVS